MQENEGGGALGTMLAGNLGLRVLEMSSCRLGPAACLLIADGLKVGEQPSGTATRLYSGSRGPRTPCSA